MKNKLLLLSFFLLGWKYGFNQHIHKRPNVIIVLSDDQGYGDFSCNGNPVLQTPALDQLFRESIRFSNFHVTPLCTPSRGELMSGMDALHNKATTVLAGRNILRRDIVTMPEIFKENGYHTGIFGKWHLGDTYPDRPMDRGFEKCVWFKGWGLLSETEYDNDYYKTRYLDSLKPTLTEKYCTDLWFDKAEEWMGEMKNRKEPFFAYIATNAPHGPFYAPEDEFEKYRAKVADDKTASFLGMVSNIDKNMAHLDQWLKKNHLEDNTMVIFMNDNGGTGGVTVYNAGMRGKKGSNYDGGHRAACFIKWPAGNLGVPRTVSYPSEIQDLIPTFIDLFGLKVKANDQFDGISLKTAIDHPADASDRMLVVQFSADTIPEKYFSCVVWNSWRLVGRDELYDVSRDTGQKRNVAEVYPEILQKMRDYYEAWWKKAAPGINKLVPIMVGTPKDNPLILTSDYWESNAVNTQWSVAQAGGIPQGGQWHIQAERKGKYLLELSRWPFHIHRQLSERGPDKAIGGTKIRAGKALPIQMGCVTLNQGPPVIVKMPSSRATFISVEMEIPKGENTLQAWFRDKDGKDLCGAYYVRVTYLNSN